MNKFYIERVGMSREKSPFYKTIEWRFFILPNCTLERFSNYFSYTASERPLTHL